MHYKYPVQEGVFLGRYKRFFADVDLDGQKVTAHVVNTGSLKSCLFDGAACRLTHNADPKRRLHYTLEQIKTPNSWVGINTQVANQLAWELWNNKTLTDWQNYESAKREYKINPETRLDLALLNGDKPKRFIEVKSVTYAEDGVALFPDAQTTRGQKHIKELMQLKNDGFEVEMLFVIQRSDCHTFKTAEQIDPIYAKLLNEAFNSGLVVRAIAASLSASRIECDINQEIKLDI